MILDQLLDGVDKKRIGITSQGAVLRQHCKILDDKGLPIGVITSGCPSPTIGCNIAMAYVPSDVGSKIEAEVRNRVLTAKVTRLPFVPCTYYKKA